MYPLEIKPNVFWAGVIDWTLRDFHGYSRSPQGTTYNAYVIKDEKTALFDCVKAELGDVFLRRLEKVTALDKIDYLICHHLELDHSGALPRLVELVKPKKILCSPAGLAREERWLQDSICSRRTSARRDGSLETRSTRTASG